MSDTNTEPAIIPVPTDEERMQELTAFLQMTTTLEAYTEEVTAFDFPRYRKLMSKVASTFETMQTGDESMRALLAEADSAIREHAAMTALATQALEWLVACKTFFARATASEFRIAEGMTIRDLHEFIDKATERLGGFPTEWKDLGEVLPFRFVTALGYTAGQMRANLAATDEGQALLAAGDVQLVWVATEDLWNRAARASYVSGMDIRWQQETVRFDQPVRVAEPETPEQVNAIARQMMADQPTMAVIMETLRDLSLRVAEVQSRQDERSNVQEVRDAG